MEKVQLGSDGHVGGRNSLALRSQYHCKHDNPIITPAPVPVSTAQNVHQWPSTSDLDDKPLNEDATFEATKVQMQN